MEEIETMKKLHLVVLLSLNSIFLFAGGNADAAGGKSTAVQSAYPSKPIEVTCVFGAGSAADTITRKFSDLAQKVLGQPLPVVNRTGGGTAVGYNFFKDQKGDGYSMIWTSNGLLTAYYQGTVDFGLEAFRSVAQISYEPVSIAVRADAPWKTMEEFFLYIKDNPGKVRIGNSGVGTYTHIVAAALENRAGSRIVHVPFGQGLAFASLMGGQIEASIQLPSEVIAQYEAKQVRILAVTSGERIPSLPEVPTLKQSNIDLEMILWRGISVPRDTPDEIVAVLENAARTVVTSSEFKDFCETMSIIPSFQSAADFDRFAAEDSRLIGELMKAIGTNKR
jgi:tripartite-type tricarboxylate transporter receptor subunit TctC